MPPKKASSSATPSSIITTRAQKRKLSIIDNNSTNNNNNEIITNTALDNNNNNNNNNSNIINNDINNNNNSNNDNNGSNIASSSKTKSTKSNKKSKTQIIDNESTDDDNATPPEIQPPRSPKGKEPETSKTTKTSNKKSKPDNDSENDTPASPELQTKSSNKKEAKTTKITKAKTKRQTMAEQKKEQQELKAKSYKTRSQLAIYQRGTYTAAMLDKRGQIQRKEYFSKVVLTPRDPEKHNQLVTIVEGSRVRQFGATDEDSKKWWKIILIFTNKASPSAFPNFQCELEEEPYTEVIFSLESVLEIQPPSPTYNKEVSNVAFTKAKGNNDQPVHHRAPTTHPHTPAPSVPTSSHSIHSSSITNNTPTLQQIFQQVQMNTELLHKLSEKFDNFQNVAHKDVVGAYQDSTAKLFSLAQNK